MQWDYERKEVADRRLDSYLAEMGSAGWEMVHCHRGRETRVGRDPDFWELIWKRPRQETPPPA